MSVKPRFDRVAVIGAGFIGSHVVRELLHRGYDVVTLARAEPTGLAQRLVDGSTVVVGDAGVHATISEVVAEVDHVILALNSLMPAEADANPSLDMTLMLGPLLTLLDELGSRRPQIGLTLMSSGGTVYGDADVIPTPECASTNPRGAYGITKLVAEKFVLRHHSMHGSPVRIVRIANAYGPGQASHRGQGVIAAALQRAASGRPVSLFGDGCVKRDFVHVDDIAIATAELMALSGGGPIVNVGSGSSVTMTDVVRLVEEVTQSTLEIDQQPDRPFDVRWAQLDISLLQSLIPFSPRPLRDGIQQTWDYVKSVTVSGLRTTFSP